VARAGAAPRYLVGGTIVLENPSGEEVLRSDVTAEDVVDDLEKPIDDVEPAE
jgi:hypothetical protein